MKMMAAVMHEQGLPAPFAESQPFRIQEVDLEGPGDGEVLVEIRAAGICHSDLSQVKGLRKRQLPVVGGHEAAGIVRELGRGVRGLSVGDHVVMTVVSGCGNCDRCKRDRPALCEAVTGPRTRGLLANGQRRLSLDGQPLFHYSGISGFAQYAVAMPDSLVPMPKSVPFETAAIFGCAVLTGAGAVFNTARLAEGDTVVVIGLGGVGLSAMMAAKIAGAATIVGIDLKQEKFPVARELGATHVLHGGDPQLAEQVREITRGGADFVIDMTGARPVLRDAALMLRPGGEIICVGLGATNAIHEYDHTALVSQERSIRGCFMGSAVPRRDIPRYFELYEQGHMPVGRLTSECITFGQLNQALDRLDGGEAIRQVLLPHAPEPAAIAECLDKEGSATP